MRLLNSATVKLEEFPDDRIPKYAILSHRTMRCPSRIYRAIA
jgi:hypothetical protein